MKHFLIVISIIVLVSLPFLYPSIENAEDGSFNDYEYLQKFRRTHSDVNTDNKSKGWQDNGIFNSWHQPGNDSENDKALNNLTDNKASSTSDSNTPQTQSKTTSTPTPITETKDKSETTNILPYLLLVLLLMVVIVIIYIKYNYNLF